MLKTNTIFLKLPQQGSNYSTQCPNVVKHSEVNMLYNTCSTMAKMLYTTSTQITYFN